MVDFLRGFFAKLFGPKDEEDPLGDISADQLAIVLRSIEDKYGNLTDENARLRDRVESLKLENARLQEAFNEVATRV